LNMERGVGSVGTPGMTEAPANILSRTAAGVTVAPGIALSVTGLSRRMGEETGVTSDDAREDAEATAPGPAGCPKKAGSEATRLTDLTGEEGLGGLLLPGPETSGERHGPNADASSPGLRARPTVGTGVVDAVIILDCGGGGVEVLYTGPRTTEGADSLRPTGAVAHLLREWRDTAGAPSA